MTMLGKLLVFLNLIFGIGCAVYATSVYTNRPGWLEDLKDANIEKGQDPRSIPRLAAEIDAQGKAAAIASANWGANSKALDAAEALRVARHRRMFGTLPNADYTRLPGDKGLIDYAKEGDIPNSNGAAFLDLVEDPGSKLLNLNPDLTAKGVIVRGPNAQPLKGTDKLLDQFTKDSAEAEMHALESKRLREQARKLGDEIVLTQNQIHKQREIRDNLVIEAARLEAFEVNATEHRQTVTRRRQQLVERLAPFKSLEKK
jgi:hypothetical protein